jgi:peroxiredoxin
MSPLLSKARAPELRATRWFNSPPLSWKELRGKVVMIDFLTYSCVNCVRTFPHMRYLWSQLKDKGFVLIGVQTPEFVFEKEAKNIEDAIKRHGLEYPIAVDNDYEIWNAFGNRYWPAQFFIDKDGYIRHFRAGEGGEQEIEEWIALLLRQAGHPIELGAGPHEEEVRLLDPITSETYCGFLRNTGMGNPSDCDANGHCAYHDQDKTHQLGVIYLDGQWKQAEEYLEHEGEQKGHILLKYQAREVNLVMTAENKGEVEVVLDDKPLPRSLAGPDVKFEGERSFLVIDRQDMFRIVMGKEVEMHELRLVTSSAGLKCYAYTFG